MRNMQSTFDLTSFKGMNAPKFGLYEMVSGIAIPRGEELFGRIFYAIIDEKIYALKILAWALNGRSNMYLIQTPTFTKWMSLSDIPLFTSVNDLVEGKGKFYIPVDWPFEAFKDIPKDLRLIRNGCGGWEIRQSFYYYKSEGRVNEKRTKIEYIVGTSQGVFFGLVQDNDCYATKDECLLAEFNGMDIVDFAEPTIIEVKIEIPSAEVVTRKLVLE